MQFDPKLPARLDARRARRLADAHDFSNLDAIEREVIARVSRDSAHAIARSALQMRCSPLLRRARLDVQHDRHGSVVHE
jgi:hypothetical protein